MTDYPTKPGKPTEIVSFRNVQAAPLVKYASTVKKDLAEFTGKDTLPQIFIGGKYRGDDKKIISSWVNGDLLDWLDQAKVKYNIPGMDIKNKNGEIVKSIDL